VPSRANLILMSKFYAVARGRNTGVFRSWEECVRQVEGYSGALHRSFKTHAAAMSFLQSAVQAPKPAGHAPRRELAINFKSRRGVKKETMEALLPTDEEHEDFKRRFELSDDTAKLGEGDDIPHLTAEQMESLLQATGTQWVEIFTDGACLGNGKDNASAGVGVWFGENDARNISEKLKGNQTNQRAELMAIIRALEATDPSADVIIKSDSAYAIKCVTEWLPGWRSSNFKNGKVVNMDLILRLDEIVKAREGAVLFEEVDAHSGIYGNESADKLAKAGCLKS